MSHQPLRAAKGYGSAVRPTNRYASTHCIDDLQQVADDEAYLAALGQTTTEYLPDDSRSIVSENASPDINFRYSVNPYRGCAHGCCYCYARPTHEFLGLSAGIDFESKVFVKHNAAALLREWLARDAWQPEMIVFSGVTDCYQPAERKFRLTRACLEVVAEHRQPIGIVTKNALVTRDLDLLVDMAANHVVRVAISVTTLDPQLAREMEPQTSTPEARLRAISELAAAGVSTHVMVAPIIPGLNDEEIPSILAAARQAGAESASYVILRLPGPVREIFLDWLARKQPDKKQRIVSRILELRSGKMNDARFGRRMRGEGIWAEQIEQIFRLFAKKYGLDATPRPLETSLFRRPLTGSGQMRLFD